MAKIPPNNKLSLKGDNPVSKRHFEMTEEEKAKVVTCTGTKDNHPCKNPMFRCIDCGNYGCDQNVAEKCSAQGFKNDKCLHCGETGTRMPIMKGELEKYIAEWEKEVPELKE